MALAPSGTDASVRRRAVFAAFKLTAVVAVVTRVALTLAGAGTFTVGATRTERSETSAAAVPGTGTVARVRRHTDTAMVARVRTHRLIAVSPLPPAATLWHFQFLLDEL